MKENPSIISIVEGPGERRAFPGLVRRILHERLSRFDVSIMQAKVANGKPSLLKNIEQWLRYARLEHADAILVLIDADEECPYEKAGCIARRASTLNLDVPVSVVYAKAEYETWFICSLSCDKGGPIRERLDIHQSINMPKDVEDIRGAKEWLNSKMPRDRAYQATADQEPLTYHIDLDLTHRRSRSFRRLCHAVEELVWALDNCVTIVTPGT